MKTIAEFMDDGIRTVADLRDALQTAMRLEFATIPPYLCAQWSIDPGHDPGGVARMIGQIVIQEMYHFALAGNVLAAIGGKPAIANAAFVTTYPSNQLPGGIPQRIPVDLKPLCDQPPGSSQLDVFLQIECPEFPPVALLSAPPPTTIGAFYDTISEVFTAIDDITFDTDANFVEFGEAVAIKNVNDAQAAIARIRGEGEGSKGSPDEPPADGTQLAHYYVFKEILRGAKLVQTNGVWDFTGPAIPFPTHVYAFEPSDVRPSPSLAFNRLLGTLLTNLQACWTTGTTVDTDTMDLLRTEGTSLIRQGIRPEFIWANPS
jgi:hypothetical protein